jgi:CRISPR/Cas system CSM-associated protein Csm5 (group 7 of RAMP superfamily)
MVWRDQVNVLDQRRIFQLLAKGPRLDSYLSQLKRADKLDFASWGGFAQNFAGRRIPFEHSSLTAYWEKTRAESLFIPTFATNLNGPYLPATAVKGILRTGVIFTRWSHATIEDAAHRAYAQAADLAAVDQNLQELEGRLAGARQSGNACLVSIGWGGGFFGKAAYIDTSDEALRRILRNLPFYSRAIQTGLPFPKTRRIVFLENRPAALPGWALLEVA